ncbi:MAG: EFR1 family ferrodoxin [Candidatus Aureabacteria bacterium]|nr:EFR1 family ferrodoxin [Candidatus Auribacterota bacterium]
MKSVAFYYFTGTGNTLLVVKEMAAVFSEQAVSVELLPLERADPRSVKLEGTIGLAFPVAAQSTYPFVWRFVEGMPRSAGAEVFMVDTLAGFSGGIVGPLKRLLTNKGYIPVGASEIIMPSNFFPKKRNAGKEERVKRAGLVRARRFALALIEGKGRWEWVPVLSDIVCWMSRSSLIWNYLRKLFPLTVDSSRCIRCGVCVKLCPVKNIVLPEFPVFSDRCQVCMRCISFCPTGAIVVPKKKYEVYRATDLTEIQLIPSPHPLK